MLDFLGCRHALAPGKSAGLPADTRARSKDYCYLPLYIFSDRHLLSALLRPANIDASGGRAHPHSYAFALLRYSASARSRIVWWVKSVLAA